MAKFRNFYDDFPYVGEENTLPSCTQEDMALSISELYQLHGINPLYDGVDDPEESELDISDSDNFDISDIANYVTNIENNASKAQSASYSQRSEEIDADGAPQSVANNVQAPAAHEQEQPHGD